jgi:hypothetical protein
MGIVTSVVARRQPWCDDAAVTDEQPETFGDHDPDDAVDDEDEDSEDE